MTWVYRTDGCVFRPVGVSRSPKVKLTRPSDDTVPAGGAAPCSGAGICLSLNWTCQHRC
ncbi:hypothetical protein DPMN_127554 [Dreissena polymorpha]|uniref:Uncharacterized protein n=1 Tax=Dreissena polymorpha TaxID=45954 RepID=A0A9D4H1G2_DREPO|nr:hypothetical protein DPMN_127554 [Dreissena polymorpha]